MASVNYQFMTFDTYISAEKIAERVRELAQQMAKDYAGRTPHFICVLNGAVFFFCDLLRAFPLDCTMSFVQLRSYDGTESTGEVEEVKPIDVDVRDRDVIVVEDIVETGLSMHYLKPVLEEQKPRSIRVVSLLYKPSELHYEDAAPDYVGFEVSREFVIGYGLDIDGIARNLPDIYTLRK